jgi:glutathione S-transferase
MNLVFKNRSKVLTTTLTTVFLRTMTSSAHHEIIYFNGAGRAEAARIAFSAAKVPFTDTRIDFAAFKAAKEAGKYGAGLPVLRIGDTEFTQSLAILRYAGKLSNPPLYPTDLVKALAVDQALDIAQDLSTKCPQDPDDDKKKALREEYAAGRCKVYCNQLVEMLERNGVFLAGSDLTIADIAVYFGVIEGIGNGNWDHFPKVRRDWLSLSLLQIIQPPISSFL